MKKWLLSLLILLFAPIYSESIEGMWTAIDDKTHKPGCVVLVYKHDKLYYGRIVATYNQTTGKIFDTIKKPEKKAPGVKGNPPYCGIDMIWNLEKKGDRYEGTLIDPEKGNTYDCEVWASKGKLNVKGKLLGFSSTQVWPATKKRDLPWGFNPNPKDFKPVIPDAQ
jgi:uncharacterized protein (DUF2147 family)